MLLAAEQDCSGRAEILSLSGSAHAGEPRRDAIRLGVEIVLEDEFDQAVRRTRARTERLDRDGRSVRERSEDGVGDVEDARAVAPTGQQREVSASPVRRERGGESAQVAGARATPRIDRLMGVADGHHARAREEGREQICLDDRRVLVLVEENDAVTRPQFGHDGGVLSDDPQRTGHLIGEVHDTQPGLLSVVVRGEGREQTERGHARGRVGDVFVDGDTRRSGGSLDDTAELIGEGGEAFEVDEVVHSVARDA
ncbi:MAG: hypothetical protein K0S70_4911 [Microbacterium sp.]|nr:hypothetical protein [Microbacterium sp.]